MTWYTPYVEITREEKWKGLLREVYQFAEKHSDDISTHTAASLVDNKGKTLMIASNGFPPGAKEIEGWDQKPKKDQISNHAERAVVYKALYEGVRAKGLTMVMPWAPCFPCANAIIYPGIKTLVCHKQMVDRTPEDWAPELADAFKLLRANNIKILMYDGKIGQCKGFMRKEHWEP